MTTPEGRFLSVSLLIAVLAASASGQQSSTIGGCPSFPANNIWNAAIETLPLDGNSAAYVNSISPTGGLRWDAVIPINMVPGTQPKAPLNIDSPEESDPGPYPIPPNAAVEDSGDQHVIVVDRDNCMLYETFLSAVQADGSWNVSSAAKWSLLSNALRPASWTSADAAGLPIMPGLVRYEEVLAGEIRHAVRFTAPKTQRLYVWPARHYASRDSSPSLPPMGQRFRLRASFDISPYPPRMQVILRALKRYGMMLADNGLAWEIQYASDPRWSEDELNTLRSVSGSNFEAVDVSSLTVNPDSGQAGGVCTPTFNPDLYVDASAQTVDVPVAADSGCVWDHSSGPTWVSVAGGATSGNSTLQVSVAANPTGAVRTATLTIGGNTLTMTQRQTSKLFDDVPPANGFFDAINIMRTSSITSGCSTAPAMFCADREISRAEMAVFVVRAVMGDDNYAYNSAASYTDVPATHPFFKFIQKMTELGITTGCGGGKYCPDEPVTRAQMAVFIIRMRFGASAAINPPAAPYFSDVPAGHPYFPWIQKMKQVGITSGCTDSQYCPDTPVTRAQMALFIMRGGFNQFLSVGAPVIVSASPSSASRGENVSVVISGQNTTFSAGASAVIAGPGIAVNSVSVLNSASLLVQLSIATDAAPGPRNLTVDTGAEEAMLPNGFHIR